MVSFGMSKLGGLAAAGLGQLMGVLLEGIGELRKAYTGNCGF